MKHDVKDQEAVNRQPPKPPIYPVEVIEAACRALEAMVGYTASDEGAELCKLAFRIIRDGLASHEKAIRGEP